MQVSAPMLVPIAGTSGVATAGDLPTTPAEATLEPQLTTHEKRLEVANHASMKGRGMMDKEWYPEYHIAPFSNWMGVPGGLCHHNGVYHVFYQQNPYSENWGLMHWAHLTSEDLVNWQHQPIALAPSEAFDCDGCFSGSAVSYNNELYIFYTGHSWNTGSDNGGTVNGGGEGNSFYQQQCVAVSNDGINFEKLGAVVRPPPGYVHFRDPKVWYRDGRWWMVCGARDESKDIGQLLLYTTTDLRHWDDGTWQVLGVTDDKNVFMWECPDLFQLDQLDVFLFSPQGKRCSGYRNRNRFQSGYIVGNWNTSLVTAALAQAAAATRKTPANGGRVVGGPRWLTSFDVTQRFREIDRGHDFYGPQTLTTVDGRQLIIAWMDIWESPMPTREHGWSGGLTLPRELILDPFTGSIRMVPPKELMQLRCAQATIPAQRIAENTDVLLVEDCTAYELDVAFNTETSTAEKYGLWLGSGAELYVDMQSRRLVLNRHYPQHMLSGYRSCEMPSGVQMQLRVFIDRSSMEVFVNDGEETFTTRIFPSDGDRTLRIFSINGTTDMVGGNMWKLRSTVKH